ncbi:MAG TPA: ABC transporter transmembrane domain-containing protein [Vicinamibacteria bacterium]|nr:ABC transporter transmembrane domain-containing protein [Vicinamibacteria bacterium]
MAAAAPVSAPPPPPPRRGGRSSGRLSRLGGLGRSAVRDVRELRRLFAYARPYRGLLALSWTATMGYAAASALLAHMVEPIFDNVLIRNVDVARVALTIVGLYAVKGLCAYLSTTLVAAAGQGAVTDLRNALYSHVLNQSFTSLGRTSTGSLMSSITTDVEKIQYAVSEIAGDVLKESLTVAGLAVVLFVKDWRLALLSLVGMPLAFYPLVRLGRHVRSSSETSLRRWRDISEILQETISGFRVVKAFGMEGFETARFRRAAQRLLNVNMRITRTTAVLPPLMELVGGLALVAALFYGSHEILARRLTTGEFTSFLAALFAMYTPIKRLSRVNATVQGALAAGERVFEVLDTHQEITEAPDAIALPRMREAIEYRDVGFRYSDGDGSVLRRVSFSARAGEVVAIVGTSGAGKTTLMNLLPRFYDVSEGAILVDGTDIRAVTVKSLREQIGLVTQETVLFNDTVRANIAYGLDDVDEARIESAARAAFAHDFVLDLPRRYDTVIGERGSRLSGGQRQRIAIARALLKDPPILILDEATSSLDAESERLVQEALANLMKGRTTLVIAHRLATVRRADRIVVLDGGEVREVGTHEELLRRAGGLYSRLYELQFSEEPAL